MMKKYLIDTSLIGSELTKFKLKFCSGNSILVMADLTLDEIEGRKVDSGCTLASQIFARFLIDYFISNIDFTETVILPRANANKHIDSFLVDYAKENNLIVLTCDKAMALRCRFQNVDYELLPIRPELYFITFENNQPCICLKNILKGTSILVSSDGLTKKFYDLDKNIYLSEGDTILVASPAHESGKCLLQEYLFSSERATLISKDIISSEDETSNHLKKDLFFKWSHHMATLC